ncbi:MAG: efflux RND transporter periplasmic adaptor subunit [Gallionellaceae bacterium]|jgi:Cu(I)/Ag(I) efflux system membrane fusion protein
MKPNLKISLLLLVAVVVGAGGFFLGKHQTAPEITATKAQTEHKVLYYRNPMGLPDTSPVPKQDSMGMDYVAVYEGEDMGSGTVTISPEKVQLLGVRTEAVQRRALTHNVRATGMLEVDERKQQWVSPRFEGWVQQLQVNATGQRVTRGQPLLTVYSPELESAAREVQLAHESGLAEVEKSARSRLDNWQIEPQDLEHLQHGTVHLILRSPIDGVVIEKMAVAGARFAPGEVLFKLADLSSVWLQAEVAEQDQGALHIGQTVDVKVDAYAQEKFSGKVSFIAPVLNEKTRTVRVRVELPNKEARLRPGMYASVVIAEAMPPALTIPLSAVIDSGTRQVVLVQVAVGRFQPRVVQLGARSEEHIAVLNGLNESELVVTSANFLIDAESNLKAALGSFGHAHADNVPQAEAKTPTPPVAEQAGHVTQVTNAQPKPAVTGHPAQGVLKAVKADGMVSITHEPIASLGWPGMTMDFALANSSLVTGIQTGSAITFEIVERKPGAWVITKLQAAPQNNAQNPQHAGH